MRLRAPSRRALSATIRMAIAGPSPKAPAARARSASLRTTLIGASCSTRWTPPGARSARYERNGFGPCSQCMRRSVADVPTGRRAPPEPGRWEKASSRALVADRVETRPESIEQKELADKRLSYAGYQLDGFQCLQGADDAGQRAEHSGLCARGHQSRRRRFGKKVAIGGKPASVGGGFERLQHGHRAVEPADCSVHQRALLCRAGIGDGIARFEIVRAVRHQIVLSDQVAGVSCVDPQRVEFDGDMRIDAPEGIFCTVELGGPD